MKEKILFEKYKNTPDLYFFKDRERLREKYPDVNISDLYAKVIQYQIKKYGIQLSKQKKRIKHGAI